MPIVPQRPGPNRQCSSGRRSFRRVTRTVAALITPFCIVDGRMSVRQRDQTVLAALALAFLFMGTALAAPAQAQYVPSIPVAPPPVEDIVDDVDDSLPS